jgi:S1-C subfamily serine protease
VPRIVLGLSVLLVTLVTIQNSVDPIQAMAASVPRPAAADVNGNGYLGVTMGIDDTLVISDVRAGYPAQKAGLLPGDEFLQIGSVKPRQFSQVSDFIYSCRPGTTVTVVVRRDGQPKSVTVTLEDIPDDLREQILARRRERDEQAK